MKYTKINEHMIGLPLGTMDGQITIVATFEGESKRYVVGMKDGQYFFHEKNIEDGRFSWKPCHIVPIEIIKGLSLM